ncbi:LLM class flavin-dependent oxidoreductase [Arcicella aquatica]|uniref:LLM class flavin-dependent oxidoreductase n=1 Tax=Arcicella aquatica TaxID=217141 RepID=A0ABU5QPR1_9BACT|nr:LLM class flavin-dependent oxidoreductase [Arcicella aquatica]MEA5258664.1 LLM class flavin-dependent oxidoreductase [Arcicella aquatica]
MKKIKLSILDQSIIHPHSTALHAIQETIETVQLAERLGYHRFWVSEHHNSTFIAGSTPEVLMVKLADETNRIRIGSGGIMLPNHSALKVAENFRMLETLFPGRIDLGMGRAPGGDTITASLLNPSNDFKEESYLRQLSHLQHFFTDSAGTSKGRLLAIPQASTIPMQWILSSSGGSSGIASQFGMGLAVAKFINGHVNPDIVEHYRKSFTPSSQFNQPKELIALSVICADTEEKARQMRHFHDYTLVKFEQGLFDQFVSYEEMKNYDFSMAETARIKANSARIISGTKDEVKEKLTQLANKFDIDEIMVSTLTDNKEDRLHSFELLAEAFGLAE